jgi:organic radical activating enzyme
LVADVWNQRHPNGGKKAPPLVVFTGGEPLRQQQGLTNAIIMLMPLRMIGLQTIEIETNGTYAINDLDESLPSGIADCMSYVISPKTMRINRRYPPDRTVFKYVVSAANVSPDDGLPHNVLGQNQPTDRPIHLSPLIYVQPQDDKDPEVNARNRQTAIESCMRFGYRLSLQTQKILELP